MSQSCRACGSASPDGAKFCTECGTALARACPACGTPSLGGRFCAECGSPLTAAPSPAALTTAPVSERRTTTVLFGDLVSFTTLSEQRDPEEVRELLSAYFAVARTVVGRYGGTVEKFIGDAVMAVWGVPVSHEDDAERAVRAGLDLVAEVSALGARVGAPGLAMRVGVTTGSVAVTLGAVGEGMVAGDAVNTAARVQAAAEPGTVWTDQETRELTAAAIAYTEVGEHALKGKEEPVRLARADAVVAAVGGAQRVDGLEAPLTGRDGEVRRVKELFHATEADGRARLVVVTGLPGIGKSRLGWEFEKYADGLSDGVRWHRGRSLSYGEGVGFWAFAEMVRSRLGLAEGADREQTRARIREGLAVLVPDAAEADWLAPRLEALLGVWDGSAFERTNLFAAWTAFLDRVGSPGGVAEPVVLLFEDAQYADSGMLDLVEHLLDASRARLFVLLLTRPELLDARPSLAASRHTTVLELGPLSEDALATLVDGLVIDLPDAARRAVVERCDGVPLYAVETVRTLVDVDAVVPREGRYVFVDHDGARVDLAQLTAPRSLQTLIASRLDALTPLERRTVQDASVLGLVFRRSGLAALADAPAHEVDAALAGLVRKDVVEELDDARSPERGQYRFVQAMVREVAYGTLARRDRRARHLAVADHLEAEGDAAAAAVVAQHLLDALLASVEGEDRDELQRRARQRLSAAAEAAHALGSSAEALRLADAAFDLDPEPHERARLLTVRALAAAQAGQTAAAIEVADEAIAAYEGSEEPVEVVRLLGRKAVWVMHSGRAQEALDLTERGLAVARTVPDRLRATDVAPLWHCRSNAARALGLSQLARESAVRGLAEGERDGDPGAIVRGLNSLSIAAIDEGSPTAYRALAGEAVRVARSERLLAELGNCLPNLGAYLYSRDLGQAREVLAEALEVNRQLGDPFGTELSLVNASVAWWLHGEWDRLDHEVAQWLADREVTSLVGLAVLVWTQVRLARGQLPPGVVVPPSDYALEQVASTVAEALVAAADGAEPAAVASTASTAFDTAYTGDAEDDIEVALAPTAELLLAAGDHSAARRVLASLDAVPDGSRRPLARHETSRLRGLISLAEGGDPEADLRAAIEGHDEYGAPYLAARSRLELGRWLHRQGRREEATPLLAEARRAFVVLGATPSVEEVDAVLSGVVGAEV